LITTRRKTEKNRKKREKMLFWTYRQTARKKGKNDRATSKRAKPPNPGRRNPGRRNFWRITNPANLRGYHLPIELDKKKGTNNEPMRDDGML
jgi:hypothetical protein